MKRSFIFLALSIFLLASPAWAKDLGFKWVDNPAETIRYNFEQVGLEPADFFAQLGKALESQSIDVCIIHEAVLIEPVLSDGLPDYQKYVISLRAAFEEAGVEFAPSLLQVAQAALCYTGPTCA